MPTLKISPVWKEWIESHPQTAVALIALLAAVVSCYPVVFGGKSFVSPLNAPLYLLYDRIPSLPGAPETQVGKTKGSDIAATAYNSVPWSVIASRSVFEKKEAPLWNRYNSCGVTLVGQGIALFGDPLHWLVLAGGGKAWAWDVKFVLAKFLFCLGMGWLCWRLTGNLVAAGLVAVSSAFLGFFGYRFNHPAFFTVSYAPWILLAWERLARQLPEDVKSGWVGLLLLANWMVGNSGAVKEAAMLILFFNGTGLGWLAVSGFQRHEKLKRLGLVGLGAGLLACLSAPFWMMFGRSLAFAYTAYDKPAAHQIQPAFTIGFFDDLFYRQLMPVELHFNPSTNFLVLFGVLWGLARIKEWRSHRFWWPVAGGAIVAWALVFGVVPGSLLTRIPFIANISHIDNTFSCVLLVYVGLLAGLGLTLFQADLKQPHWWAAYSRTQLGLAVLLGGYFAAVTRPELLEFVEEVSFSPFFRGYAGLLLFLFVGGPIVLRIGATRHTPVLIRVALTGFLLAGVLGRQGMHLSFNPLLNNYVMNPRSRMDYQVSSPAVDLMKREGREPFRVVGFGNAFFPGYGGVLELEGIAGPDPLVNRHYRELLQAFNLECEWDWHYIVRPDQVPQVKPLLNLLNVRYLLGGSATAAEIPPLGPAVRLDMNVYANREVWPRAFFTNQVTLYSLPQDLAAKVRANPDVPLAAVQESDTAVIASLGNLLAASGEVRVIAANSYQLMTNATSFSLQAPTDGVVVLSEAYLKDDFQVVVDGQPQAYFRVNHAFKGIQVGAGSHQIKVVYWPRGWILSLWLAALGGMGLLVWSGWLLVWNRKRWLNRST